MISIISSPTKISDARNSSAKHLNGARNRADRNAEGRRRLAVNIDGDLGLGCLKVCAHVAKLRQCAHFFRQRFSTFSSNAIIIADNSEPKPLASAANAQ